MAVTMTSDPVQTYLKQAGGDANTEMIAYTANLAAVAKVSPEVAAAVVHELADQRTYLKLIASENYCSLSTQLAMGNLLTDKYAEGFAHARFYEGCDNVDTIEALACEEACKLFGADHAYVQPHSGADANMVAFWAILQARVGQPALDALDVRDPNKLDHSQWEVIRKALGNQRILGLNLAAGGHLTHGFRHNVSGKMFDAHQYGVSEDTGLLDYDAIEAQAMDVKPLILLAGYSAYPRAINFKRMRAIADKCGAVLMVDMAHFAGLVAGKVFTGDEDPVAHAQVVTSTTHKTLRGPRGGIVLCTKEFAEYVDKGCPYVLGGPLPHIMGAKAVSFIEANRDNFKDYAARIVGNARALAGALVSEGFTISSGGTDNHLMLIDCRPQGITGRQAASALRDCSITLNKNAIPFDPETPMITSGLRLGTPALTTLGMGPDEMTEVAKVFKTVLTNTSRGAIEKGPNAGKPSKVAYELDAEAAEDARAHVRDLLGRFPLYPELDLAFLQEHFPTN